MQMSLEQTYKAVILKEMLEQELKELESVQKNKGRKKMISRATMRKILKRSFIWLPVFMIFVNYVRNGIDPFIFIYAPVFLFYTSVYTSVILLFLWIYNSAVKYFLRKKKVNPKEVAFYEQNKKVVKVNIKTVELALKNQSSLMPKYHTKEVLEQLIAYKREGRVKTDQDAIKLFTKEHPSHAQPVSSKSGRVFTKMSLLIRTFIGTVAAASLFASGINHQKYRKGW
ncbi:hypothetical protein [Sporosarcina luteola]|uniref:hypothetical protein n=1 Tax=Sporosarcina luteola TaxID=582850 RepID=UPI00203BD6B7|nr:hypothetical protein [Sporosarcina luteola]MCM3711022.1 hypothetical protein [Sporosarcina luteola]